MKYGFISLGCSKNLVDSENIVSMFNEAGLTAEKDPSKCDIIFINTCGFILPAKQEAIDTILEMAEYKKDKLKYLIVSGCLVQRYQEELKKEIPEVDAFISLDEYPRMHLILKRLLNYDFKQLDPDSRYYLTPNHFAYLKIAEGCNHRCAYCAIPLIRGNYKSYPKEDLLLQAKELSKKGVKELVIVAQDSAYYGKDLYGYFALPELLKELDELDFEWIRILYLYADELNEEMLETIKNSKHILPYFDMPVQYGSDRILKAMRRPTTVKFLKEKFNLIHQYFNGEEILRTTFMVGFPSEEEKDFKETLNFIEEEKFDSLGCFMYSREEDTYSYKMENQVAEEIKKQRYETLMLKQKEIVEEINQKRINKSYKVLVEEVDYLNHKSYGRAYFSAPEGVDPVIIIGGELKVGEFYECEIYASIDYDLLAKVRGKDE